MREDIQFLKELQAELITQDTDIQASPRYWGVGDYKWVECSEGNAERYSVYIPNAAESYEINYFLKEVIEEDEISEEALEEFKEISCEVSAFEWIQRHYDENASLHPECEEHYVRHSTMFLTKAEAKRHIELNHYHYTNKAHTYAMTAWRAPKVERLFKILETFDWNKIEELAEERSFFLNAYVEKVMAE